MARELTKVPDKSQKVTKTKGQGTKKVGRPSIFTQELADKICEKLAVGESIRTVCGRKDMPSVETFFRWIRTNEEFREQYARAKEEAADAMAEDLLDISDDGTNDWMFVQKGNYEGWELNGEALQRSRLRVDTRKWLMAKMKPKKYGDKLDVTSDGKALPTPISAVQINLANTTDDKKSLNLGDGVSENAG